MSKPSPRYGLQIYEDECTTNDGGDIIAPSCPEPVVTETVCSLCGFDWEDHGENPTTDDCIRLLRDRVEDLENTPVPFKIAPAPYTPPPYNPVSPYGPWVNPFRPPYYGDQYKITCGPNTGQSQVSLGSGLGSGGIVSNHAHSSSLQLMN